MDQETRSALLELIGEGCCCGCDGEHHGGPDRPRTDIPSLERHLRPPSAPGSNPQTGRLEMLPLKLRPISDEPFIPPPRLTLAPLSDHVYWPLRLRSNSAAGGGVTPWALVGRAGDGIGITAELHDWFDSLRHPDDDYGSPYPNDPGARKLLQHYPVASAPFGTSHVDQLVRIHHSHSLRPGVDVGVAVLRWEPASRATTLLRKTTDANQFTSWEEEFVRRNRVPTFEPPDAPVGTFTLAAPLFRIVDFGGGEGIYRLRVGEDEHPALGADYVRIGGQDYGTWGVARRSVDIYAEARPEVQVGSVVTVMRRGGNRVGARQYSDSAGNRNPPADTNVISTLSVVASGWRPRLTHLFPVTLDASPDRQEGRWQGRLPPAVDPDWPGAALKRAHLTGRQGDALRVEFPAFPFRADYGPLNLVLTYRTRREGVRLAWRLGWYADTAATDLPQTGRHWAQLRIERLELPPGPAPHTVTFRVDGPDPIELSSIVFETVEARLE